MPSKMLRNKGEVSRSNLMLRSSWCLTCSAQKDQVRDNWRHSLIQKKKNLPKGSQNVLMPAHVAHVKVGTLGVFFLMNTVPSCQGNLTSFSRGTETPQEGIMVFNSSPVSILLFVLSEAKLEVDIIVFHFYLFK